MTNQRLLWSEIPAVILSIFAGLTIVAMMLHVTADVIGRVVFHHPINGTLEIVSTYYMVAIIFLPLAFVLRNEGHIEVTLFTQRLPSGLRHWLRIAVGVIGIGSLVYLFWRTLEGGLYAYDIREVRGDAAGVTVVWPTRFYLPIGIGTMLLYMITEFFALILRGQGTETDIATSLPEKD